MEIIQGKFIALKPLAVEHAELVIGWRSSSYANFLNRGSTTVEEQIMWTNSRPTNEYNFVIYFQDKAIGQISLYNINEEHKTAEAGRLILDDKIVRGFPITFESILLIHNLAFYDLNLNKICGVVASGNVGAVKLNDFVKMRREGTLRQQFYLNGSWQDGILFGLLREEFISFQEPFLKKLINLKK